MRLAEEKKELEKARADRKTLIKQRREQKKENAKKNYEISQRKKGIRKSES